jgi:tryptophan-rich sensory protein
VFIDKGLGATVSRPIKPVAAIAWVAVALLAGAVGGMAAAPGAWYAGLDKPSWNPPSWVFGPVWTTLYVMMGLAAALAWGGRGTRAGRTGFSLFALQLGLNALWSWLFFHWHRPDLALVDLAVLWVTILGNIIAFRRIRPAAGWLLVPYLCWVTFAGVLNASIASRNPPDGLVGQARPVVGIAVADCAPWDGAATSIYISEVGDAERLPPAAPYLHIIVYEAGERLPGLQVTLGGQDAGSGAAVRCQADDECAASNAGTVEFGKSEPDGALLGAYRLEFADGPVSGTFRALWNRRTAMCG